jgi:hypothetical protein
MPGLGIKIREDSLAYTFMRTARIAKQNQGLELSKLAYSLDFLLLFYQEKGQKH